MWLSRLKIRLCNCCGTGSIPGQGNFHIPQAQTKKGGGGLDNHDYEKAADFPQDTDPGVPLVAWQVKNPTSIHEDAGSICGLAPCVKYPVLLSAVVKVTDTTWISSCCGSGVGWQLQLQLDP